MRRASGAKPRPYARWRGAACDHKRPRLDAPNLPALAAGCAAVGAGGGGDPDLALTMALRAVGEHGAVPVVGLDDLDDEALVMPCGMVGAPTIADERVWSGGEGSDAARHGRAAPRPARPGAHAVADRGCQRRPPGDVGGPPRAAARRCRRPGPRVPGVAAARDAPRRRRGRPGRAHRRAGDTIVIHLDEEPGRTGCRGLAAGAWAASVRPRCTACAGARRGRRRSAGRSPARWRSGARSWGRGRRRLAAVVAALGAKRDHPGHGRRVERAAAALSRGAATVQSAGRAGRRRVCGSSCRTSTCSRWRTGRPRDGARPRLGPRGGHGRPVLAERLAFGQRVTVVASPGARTCGAPGRRSRSSGPASFGYDLDYTLDADGERDAGG